MTSLKQHLLNMARTSLQYESDKCAEAKLGSNKTVQQLHRANCIRIVGAAQRIEAWQPTISATS